MGQYWIPASLDRKEFFHPHRVGSFLKLWEQLAGPEVGAALIMLLAAEREVRGCGDLDVTHPALAPVVGRWAGNRIVLVGDYAEDEDLPGYPGFGDLYWVAQTQWTDISAEVRAALDVVLEEVGR